MPAIIYTTLSSSRAPYAQRGRCVGTLWGRLTAAIAMAAVLAILSLAFPFSASANGTQDCVVNCMGRGQAQGACMQSCGVINMDYRCLNLCVAQGTPAGSCRTSCTYLRDDVLAPQQAQRSTPNSPFTTLYPTDPGVVVPIAPTAAAPGTPGPMLSPRTQPLSPSTNYQCVAQCDQNGFAYSYCKQKCSY